jgi:hypothetical protein
MRIPITAGGLVTALLVGGCATGRGPEGPIVSVNGVQYPTGSPPRETRRSQTATLYLRQNRVDRGLARARGGLETE